jgi:site-specific DNA recombinase
VKRIFELYTSGRLGTAAIARQLAAEQAAAPPAGWQPAVVQWVLENEAYLGRVLWRGESLPGLHEPLIDETSFQRAQRLLRERGEDMALRRSNPGDYLLSGLLRCGRCRRAYVGASARGNGGLYHYYACSGRQKLGRKGCDGERIPRDKLEAAVIRQLAALYRNGTLIREALREAAAKSLQGRPVLEEQRRARRRRSALNGHSTGITRPSKPATSTRNASRRACPPLRRASTPCATKMPTSHNTSPPKPRQRPTRRSSPQSPRT